MSPLRSPVREKARPLPPPSEPPLPIPLIPGGPPIRPPLPNLNNAVPGSREAQGVLAFTATRQHTTPVTWWGGAGWGGGGVGC